MKFFSRSGGVISQVSVVVVDDDKALLRLYQEILEPEGYVVHTAATARDGLSLLESLPAPSLILVDCSMPGMSGEEFVTALRARRPDVAAATPIVGLSSFRKGASFLQGFEALLTEYIEKPHDMLEVIEVVARYTRPAA